VKRSTEVTIVVEGREEVRLDELSDKVREHAGSAGVQLDVSPLHTDILQGAKKPIEEEIRSKLGFAEDVEITVPAVASFVMDEAPENAS